MHACKQGAEAQPTPTTSVVFTHSRFENTDGKASSSRVTYNTNPDHKYDTDRYEELDISKSSHVQIICKWIKRDHDESIERD